MGFVKPHACKTTVDMMELKKEDFVDGVLGGVTAADFMDMTEGAEVIFITRLEALDAAVSSA
jgi:peroxiredoxin family protein